MKKLLIVLLMLCGLLSQAMLVEGGICAVEIKQQYRDDSPAVPDITDSVAELKTHDLELGLKFKPNTAEIETEKFEAEDASCWCGNEIAVSGDTQGFDGYRGCKCVRGYSPKTANDYRSLTAVWGGATHVYRIELGCHKDVPEFNSSGTGDNSAYFLTIIGIVAVVAVAFIAMKKK
jgi:LPXTG-motif cell wall-anchored protein